MKNDCKCNNVGASEGHMMVMASGTIMGNSDRSLQQDDL